MGGACCALFQIIERSEPSTHANAHLPCVRVLHHMHTPLIYVRSTAYIINTYILLRTHAHARCTHTHTHTHTHIHHGFTFSKEEACQGQYGKGYPSTITLITNPQKHVQQPCAHNTQARVYTWVYIHPSTYQAFYLPFANCCHNTQEVTTQKV